MAAKAIIVGNVGYMGELKEVNDTHVLTFNVATTGSDKAKTTHWHTIVVWGKRAQVCAKYVSKGSKVYIDAEIINRTFTNKDSVEKQVTEYIAHNVEFLSPKKESDEDGSAPGF